MKLVPIKVGTTEFLNEYRDPKSCWFGNTCNLHYYQTVRDVNRIRTFVTKEAIKVHNLYENEKLPF